MNREETIKIALKGIDTQIKAIDALRNSIDRNFTDAIDFIFHYTDRVITTGIGKSALIAKKITATLNSTGTSSIYMHASDAVHGDLGVINEKDVVLFLSKSGETAELKVLVNQVKKFGNKIIALVSNPNSFLGKNADFVLHIPIEKEADPNNLAPTSSTTAQLVMGDTIAISLLALRGFKAEHFAKFHPAGSLGNQLYLRVSDLYLKNEKPRVNKDDDLQTIIYEMSSKRLGATAVTEKDKLIGIITDGDLRRNFQSNRHINDQKAKDIMSSNPRTIVEDTLAINALAIMRKHNITQLIITKEESYLGIIHLHDLLDAGIV